MRSLLVLVLALALAACDSGPQNGQYWAKKLVKDPAARQQAVRELRKLKDPGAVPGLIEALQQNNRYKSDIADLLGELGDRSAVQPLVAAIDFDSISMKSAEAKVRNQANGRIANALGKLGDPAALDALKRLSKATDAYVQLQAVRALARLKTPEAVESFLQVIDTSDNAKAIKAALVALGDQGTVSAAPTLVRMLFVEKKASFYREASFALFQLGKEAVEPLIDALEGRNEEVNALRLDPAVVPAKVALVLGEIGGERVVPVLRGLAQFADSQSPLGMSPLVRANAIRSLGFLRDPGLLPLARKSLRSIDVGVREYPTEAVGLLGDRSVVPELLEAAGHEPYWSDCKKAGFEDLACTNSELEVRQLSARWLTRLADASHAAPYAKLVEQEANPTIKAALLAEGVRLKVAEECQQQVDCLLAKLKQQAPAGASAEEVAQAARIRDKAAFELSYLGNPLTGPPLLEALGDPDVEVRFAIAVALLRLLPKAGVEDVEKVILADRGKSTYARVDELLRRLVVKMRRSY
ncbi:MAG: HEAT repeat domain-containing protein [Myxococcota bacterium]|jgi:HEAT repeat protein|nr:HEAT repeat domain-containing protein [Myxococcota bacterium]